MGLITKIWHSCDIFAYFLPQKGFTFFGEEKFHPFDHFFRWEAFSDVFDFDTDIHPGLLADAIARERWSKEYFERLKK